MSLFTYPFINLWTYGLFLLSWTYELFGAIINKAAINTCIQVFFDNPLDYIS